MSLVVISCNKGKLFAKLKLNRKLRKMFLSPRQESDQQLSDLRAQMAEKRLRILLIQQSRYAIWVLVAQWLEHLTGDQKVAGSVPVWDLETFFWDECSAWRVLIRWNALGPVLSSAIPGKRDESFPAYETKLIFIPLKWVIPASQAGPAYTNRP